MPRHRIDEAPPKRVGRYKGRLKGAKDLVPRKRQVTSEMRAEVIRATLRSTRGSVMDTARSLGLSKNGLWFHLLRLNLRYEPRRIRGLYRRKFSLPSE